MRNKKKRSFPTAFTVLFIVLIVSAILTYVVPSGKYSKLSYNFEKGNFDVIKPNGDIEQLPGTQETLNKLSVKVDIETFKEGNIAKPIAIPNTYEKVKKNPQGPVAIVEAPIEGVYQCIEIIMFIFILGGVISVINYSGAFDAGMASLSKATKGKEKILIIIVMILIALGGTSFGLAEEIIAFYPILMPIYLLAGYDAIVCVAAIYMGSVVGVTFSTVNPFCVVIGSNAAGVNFTQGIISRGIGLILSLVIALIYIIRYAKKVKENPEKSLVYADKEKMEKKFLHGYNSKEIPEFNIKRKLMLIILLAAFLIMIWGVSIQGWWFTEMTALFLVTGIIIGVISGIGEKVFVEKFIAGAGDLIGVALITGIARGVNIIMENGFISDSVLYYSSNLVQGMNPIVFIIVMLFIFAILGFFIPSGTGLSTLSMPIMAPLADSVGISRDVIVSCFTYGQGLMASITPTGLVLASLAMVEVAYDKWLKFIVPLIAMLFGLASVLLIFQAFVGI